MHVISTAADLKQLRQCLAAAKSHAKKAMKSLAESPDPLQRLKFERFGCHPLDTRNAQNLIEQANLQATYQAAVDAMEILLGRYAGKTWEFTPGASSQGHDIRSTDKEVAAEVFAATHRNSNDKLRKDLARLSDFSGHRYVFYRCPNEAFREYDKNGIKIISLGDSANR